MNGKICLVDKQKLQLLEQFIEMQIMVLDEALSSIDFKPKIIQNRIDNNDHT